MSDFRTAMAQHFPFVVIPPELTTTILRRDSPFLFLACITVAANAETTAQGYLANKFLNHVSEHMLFRCEKSLDLLQGLLVFMYWETHNHRHSPHIMPLLHLSQSLVVDLGLNRPPSTDPGHFIFMMDCVGIIHGRTIHRARQTTAELRAFLGWHYLTSAFSSWFRRIDPPPFNEHVQGCCDRLLMEAQFPSDAQAVQLVQLHSITHRYFHHLSNRPRIPVGSLARCIENDIDGFMQSLAVKQSADGMHSNTTESSSVGTPADHRTDYLRFHTLSAKISLYESLLQIEADEPLDKAEAMFHCMDCIDELMVEMCRQPSRSYPNLPVTWWFGIVHAIALLGKLSFRQARAWDLDRVRVKLPFISIVDRLVDRLRSVVLLEEAQDGSSTPIATRFQFYSEKLALCKLWYEAKINAEKGGDSRVGTNVGAGDEASDTGAAFQPDLASLEGLFEGLDNSMWQDFIFDMNIVPQAGV
ncbi:hypothetical protein, variant [Exophiala mesophila]|uniref:Transcription factor domain-containing protein n=1 Tax=Exophiala mesophila TaxID=212818 RepID=A0A0D1Z3X7_EXOME|nr:uncharacterized protein PV10_06860 [Exophiala mesophila]XP_016221036.1 hypothetical protein, variant [Exophiala mesophila]KIV89461.1 hypothetical protein PV10_06860 [Exophiala mesophila]KIV89462.1 hypothetical protein, variant [Exophiala mesophila]